MGRAAGGGCGILCGFIGHISDKLGAAACGSGCVWSALSGVIAGPVLIRWNKKTLLQALPLYCVCLVLVGLVAWASRHYPSRNRGKSLAEAIAANIRGLQKTGATMQEIIDARRTWTPVLLERYGRRAAEWTFRDIEGVEHRLSAFRGRAVVLLFWATWSPAGFMQAGHLQKLAEESGPEGPVIIAFSEEAGEKLADFRAAHGVRFALVSVKEAPPEPFCAPWVREIPTVFFIDAEGRIKLVAEGVAPFVQAKAIVEATE